MVGSYTRLYTQPMAWPTCHQKENAFSRAWTIRFPQRPKLPQPTRRLPSKPVVLPVFILSEPGFRNGLGNPWPSIAAFPAESLPNPCRISNRPILLKYNVNSHTPPLGTLHGSKAGSIFSTPLEIVCWGLVHDREQTVIPENERD